MDHAVQWYLETWAPFPEWKFSIQVSTCPRQTKPGAFGSSWLAVYSFPTASETTALHMQSVAFADGETVTYLRGERDWIVVSGTKADRIFYRKAIIACGGKVWHHIAFEYPMALKRRMDSFVSRAAAIIDIAENDGCDTVASSTN